MKNILLVVDMQEGFLRYEQTIILREKILKLLELGIFDCIVATRFLNGANSIYEKLLEWEKLKTEKEREVDQSYIKYIDITLLNCNN